MVRLPSETRLLVDATTTLCASAECDSRTVSRPLTEAAERIEAVGPLGEPGVSPCCPAWDPDLLLFHELLRGLAGARSELFGPRLAELGELASVHGEALAFL